jgi:RND family efflux transporter MFP subunit
LIRIKMEFDRYISLRLILLALVWLVILGCDDGPRVDMGGKSESIQGNKVKVSHVESIPSVRWIEYAGILSAKRKIDVACELGGIIERLYFEKGDRVNEDQLLAEIGTTTVVIELQNAEAALRKAGAVLSEAENNYKRIEKLYETHVVSKSELDSAKMSYETALASRDQAEASLALIKDRLTKSRLRAPSNGIIAFRDVDEGEVIAPGAVITRIVDLDGMKVDVSVNEKDIHLLDAKKAFPFTVDAIPGEEYLCRLSFISPAADPATRSFCVEMAVEKRDPRMADGMTARIRLALSRKDKSIKIPSEWLAEKNGKMGVYIATDGKAIFREVTLGSYYDRRVEIVSGLSECDMVIVNPAGIRDGEPVQY